MADKKEVCLQSDNLDATRDSSRESTTEQELKAAFRELCIDNQSYELATEVMVSLEECYYDYSLFSAAVLKYEFD
jgi:hypothetical protein